MLYISFMKKHFALSLACILFVAVGLHAQDSLVVVKEAIQDSTVILTETDPLEEYEIESLEVEDPVIDKWDSLVTKNKQDENVLYLDSSIAKLFKNSPKYSEEEYIEMMKVLDDNSPFDLDYNKRVRQSINYYAVNGKEGTATVLGRSAMYFPMMEEILYENGLPLEFKYLSIVESALLPRARSRVGATGLWQFMYGTGKEQGLKIDSYVDERMDPIKSTRAACKYLNKLYRIYHDWNLVLAAYNSGPGNVNKAIRRSGGSKDFWEIKDYLPKETRGYVPSFIAVNFVYSYHEKFNIFPVHPGITYADVDTVHIKEQISFDHLKLYLDISQAELEYLNPVYYRNIIPKSPDKYALTIPRTLIGEFISNEKEMYALKPKKKKQAVASKNTNTNRKSGPGYYYKVKTGDVLGVIAERNNVGVSQLRAWNNIRGNRIYAGQKLYIKGSKPAATANQKSNKKQIAQATSDPNKRYHTV